MDISHEYGTHRTSQAWSDIMNGRCAFPAVHIQIEPILYPFFNHPSRAIIAEKGFRFHFNVQVFGMTAEERNKASRDFVQVLTKHRDVLSNRNLVFIIGFSSREIPAYPGSGPYFRMSISSMLAFPNEHKKK